MPPIRRRVLWDDDAVADLAALLDYTPAAAREAYNGFLHMAETGFNLGRQVAPGRWYIPYSKVGVFYTDDGHQMVIVGLVDARRLRELSGRE